jgi:hypothetical protein
MDLKNKKSCLLFNLYYEFASKIVKFTFNDVNFMYIHQFE